MSSGTMQLSMRKNAIAARFNDQVKAYKAANK